MTFIQRVAKPPPIDKYIQHHWAKPTRNLLATIPTEVIDFYMEYI